MAWPDLKRLWCWSHKELNEGHPHLVDALIRLSKPVWKGPGPMPNNQEWIASDSIPYYNRWFQQIEQGECPFCLQPLGTEEDMKELRVAWLEKEMGRTWCAHCQEHHEHDGEVPVMVSNGVLIAMCPGGICHPLGHEEHADEDNLYGAIVDDRGYYVRTDTATGKKHHATVRGHTKHSVKYDEKGRKVE